MDDNNFTGQKPDMLTWNWIIFQLFQRTKCCRISGKASYSSLVRIFVIQQAKIGSNIYSHNSWWETSLIPDSVFSGFPTIKTKRLMLRQPQHEDADAVFSIKSDPLVTLPYCAEPYTRMEQARGWIERLHSTYRDEEGIMWFITPIGKNNVIGSCPEYWA